MKFYIAIITVAFFCLSERSRAQQPDLPGVAGETREIESPADDALASVATLTQELQSDDPNVRWRAARSLGRFGSEAESAVPQLVVLLNDQEPVVQIYATNALSRIGDRSNATVRGLANNAGSDDFRVARTSVLALRRMQLEPEQLSTAMRNLLASENQRLMVYVVDAIVASGERATPLLKSALQENEDAAYWASIAIADIGPAAVGTVPELSALLERSDDPDVRTKALLALASIGPEARAAVPTIEAILADHKQSAVALTAAYTLGAIGSPSASATLEPLASSDDEALSLVASWALVKIQPAEAAWRKLATDKLLTGLDSEDALMRTTAAKALMDIEPPADRVARRLIEATRDSDPEVAANVVDALASLGPAIVPSVVNGLENPQLQPILINVLGRLGPDAKEAVPKLAEMLPGAEDPLKVRIHYVLAAIGPAAAPATIQIAESVQSAEPSVRHSALFALRRLGPGAADAMPQLVALLESSNGVDQLATAWALARIAPAKERVTPQLTPVLRQGLANEDPAARYETATAIANLGSSGSGLQEELQETAAGDSDERVRTAAQEALKQFDANSAVRQ